MFSYESVILVTGGRFWKDKKMMYDRLARINPKSILISGDAPGADLIAKDITQKYLGIPYIGIPYFGFLGKSGGPVRNLFMLQSARIYKNEMEGSTLHVIGFHADLWGGSAGTKHMIESSYKDPSVDSVDYTSEWCFQYPPNHKDLGHPACVGYVHHVWNGHGFVATCSQSGSFCHACGSSGWIAERIPCYQCQARLSFAS